MNPTPDTTTADDNGNFDPQQAAALLHQATHQARRRLEPYPPWLLVIRAVIVLVACGALWLSVRGQHPYTGPTLVTVVPVVVTSVIVNLGVTVAVAKRATAGVSGGSRLRRAEIAIMAVVWVGVYVVMGVLAGAGVSPSIVYGPYQTAAPLLAAGLVWAALMAARANWRRFGTAVAVAVVGAVAAFAGPVGTWVVAGVGLFVVLVGTAAVIAWQQRG
jgi:hypothetical protein